MTRTKICGNCNHFLPISIGSKEGFCHRYPPTILKEGTYYPNVYEHWDCGEWKYGCIQE